ncbi:MAG: class I SAM-dependent methyltransferase [Candidatus Velthaea sp.]
MTADAAAAYERYIGCWSRRVAADFLPWLAVAPDAAWLDVGCGSGALAQTILAQRRPAKVDACDRSSEFVARTRAATADDRASFVVADACGLPFPDRSYDAVVCGLVLPSLDDQPRALAEFVRVARPGGIIGAYVWDFDGEMQILRYFWNAATALTPQADEPDDERFAICKPEPLAAALRAAGLHDVVVTAIDAPARFANFEDYWDPFLTGTAPAQVHVQSLSGAQRTTLRERLRAALPVASDGSIPLVARAWAAKGHA